MNKYWIVFVEDDIEPEIVGKSEREPFETEDERDASAKKLKVERGDDHGIFALDIDENGVPRVWAYPGGFFLDDNEDAVLTTFKQEFTDFAMAHVNPIDQLVREIEDANFDAFFAEQVDKLKSILLVRSCAATEVSDDAARNHLLQNISDWVSANITDAEYDNKRAVALTLWIHGINSGQYLIRKQIARK